MKLVPAENKFFTLSLKVLNSLLHTQWHSLENLGSRHDEVESTSQLLWGVTLYPTLKDLTIQKCFPIKMPHKILYKWIWILLMMLHICFTLPVKNTNMLMVSDQTLFVSKKEMQNVHLIAKRKSICVICFPWKDRSSCYLIDEMLYTKLTVINTILRYHFKSCKCNALEYVLWHLHCYLLGINSSSCLKHLYWGGGKVK